MSFGMSTIKNDGDEVVIDQNHPVMRLVAAGVVNKQNFTSSGPNAMDGIYKIPVPSGTTLPILFVEWPTGVNLINLGVENGEYRIVNYDNDGPATLNYYLATFSAPTSNGGYGIEIFDGSGDLIFSTEYTHLRLKELLLNVGAPSGTLTHGSQPSLTAATVPLPLPIRIVQGSQALWFMSTCTRTNTTTLTFSRGRFMGASSLGSFPNFPYGFGPSPSLLFGEFP